MLLPISLGNVQNHKQEHKLTKVICIMCTFTQVTPLSLLSAHCMSSVMPHVLSVNLICPFSPLRVLSLFLG
jgi:hypothetical protein